MSLEGLHEEHGEGSPADALAISFYARPAELVARELLGRWIVSTIGDQACACRIVETEAYVGPHDEASHAAARIGRTTRNDVMFGSPGLAYVYRIYGVHWCLNAVTDSPGYPAAVLIRAAEPIWGHDVARQRRGGRSDLDLMRGPGNLCRALGITGGQNGHLLTGAPLWIGRGQPVPHAAVSTGPRVGVTRAAEDPLRFWIRASPYVSRHPRPVRARAPGRGADPEVEALEE